MSYKADTDTDIDCDIDFDVRQIIRLRRAPYLSC